MNTADSVLMVVCFIVTIITLGSIMAGMETRIKSYIDEQRNR